MTTYPHTETPPKTIALIPSAGMGRRMNSGGEGTRKTWLPLLGRPILAHTLDSFERSPSVDAVIVIVPASEIELCRTGIVERYGSIENAGGHVILTASSICLV